MFTEHEMKVKLSEEIDFHETEYIFGNTFLGKCGIENS